MELKEPMELGDGAGSESVELLRDRALGDSGASQAAKAPAAVAERLRARSSSVGSASTPLRRHLFLKAS